MNKGLLLLLVVTAATLLNAQHREACTEAQRRQVEKEAVTLRTWDALYDSYKKYRHCDDVDASEGYSESKARVLVDHWNTLRRAAQLIRKDGSFRRFVRVDATMDTGDVEKIRQNAKERCPTGLYGLCRELISTADEALAESAEVLPAVSTSQKTTPLEVWCTGDDGLTSRLREALEREFAASQHFALSSGKKSGTLLVTIPTNVDWKVVGKRTEVLYRVRFHFVNDKDIDSREGNCWEDELTRCASHIVQGAEAFVKNRK